LGSLRGHFSVSCQGIIKKRIRKRNSSKRRRDGSEMDLFYYEKQ